MIAKTVTQITFLLTIAALVSACASNGSVNSSTGGYGYSKKATNDTPQISNRPDSISGPITRVKTSIGEVIGGGPDNKTLYYFAKDSNGISNCDGACAAAWPPFIAGNPALATDVLTVVTRNDGSLQWAIKGEPVYFWAGDVKRGDITGNNIPDWRAALTAGL